MPKKRMRKMSEVGFVPGIYNYCDRWCEHCELSDHCMSFVMGKKLEQCGNFDFAEEAVRNDDNIWMRMKGVFLSTYNVLQRLAEERGLDIEDICRSENAELFRKKTIAGYEQQDKLVVTSDATKICFIYGELADKCLEAIFELFDKWEKQDINIYIEKEKKTTEALDVINWYLDLIQIKVKKAWAGYSLDCKLLELVAKNELYYGAAKVALIAIEKTHEAWIILEKECSDQKTTILHLHLILNQLTNEIIKYFPDIHLFKRPGFDK